MAAHRATPITRGNKTMNQTPWTFKLLSVFTGRVIVKQVVGFDNCQAAADCAKSLVPEIAQPVIVLSYQ